MRASLLPFQGSVVPAGLALQRGAQSWSLVPLCLGAEWIKGLMEAWEDYWDERFPRPGQGPQEGAWPSRSIQKEGSCAVLMPRGKVALPSLRPQCSLGFKLMARSAGGNTSLCYVRLFLRQRPVRRQEGYGGLAVLAIQVSAARASECQLLIRVPRGVRTD